MTDMIERVERAMTTEWARQMEGPRVDMEAIARAAILAMREPTDEMLRASGLFDWFDASTFAPKKYDGVRAIYQAMVDAVLE